MTITAALFDFGGVILSSPFEAFAHYEADRGLPHGFIRSVNAADHHTNAWARLERSEISPDEFAAAFEEESAAMGHRVPGWDVLGLLAGEVRPEMVEVVRRCGERLHTALLTNNVVTMRAEAMAGAPPGDASPVAEVLALFDVIVESSVVGVRKPEPRFYEIACERLGIEPSEAVFLDDLGVNLKPAKAMGMTTIKVVDPAAAIAELEQVVGFPLR
ncbi:MAG: HAD-IA family hydrolase [Acidimicrobiales bacterium]|jgi:putative hydrolase of the HAD superfamily|nr:HAD-IA family hydrolase [Acidimicrobiales bacterium]HMS89285.1 HAD-IA family hydrolase [Acidimicrobiales bacterium]